MSNPKLVTVGMVGATSIQVDLAAGILATATVQLTADYTVAKPAGFPEWPGSEARRRTGTFTSGTTIVMFAAEAAALVAVGAAEYA